MEIMDKYVLAGEALAEKENDVRQLQKEVHLMVCSGTFPIRR